MRAPVTLRGVRGATATRHFDVVIHPEPAARAPPRFDVAIHLLAVSVFPECEKALIRSAEEASA